MLAKVVSTNNVRIKENRNQINKCDYKKISYSQYIPKTYKARIV